MRKNKLYIVYLKRGCVQYVNVPFPSSFPSKGDNNNNQKLMWQKSTTKITEKDEDFNIEVFREFYSLASIAKNQLLLQGQLC